MTPLSLIIVFLLLFGFYTGSEIVLISANRIRLRHWVKQQVRGAKGVEDFLSKPDRALSTVLVGINVMLVAYSSVASLYIAGLWGGDNLRVELSPVLLTVPLLFLEVIPKTIFREHADRLALWVVPFLRFSYYLFIPVIELTRSVSNLLLRLFGASPEESILAFTKQDIYIMLKMGEEEGVLDEEERKLITSTMGFKETLVREAMVPRTEIIAVKRGTQVKEVVDLIVTTGYSRIPVYESNMDNIVGIVYAFDLLTVDPSTQIDFFIRPVPFVPEMKRCDEVFTQLRREKSHMAIVLDEYGGTAGLVTMEDLLEELVGHIYDEYDRDRKLYSRLAERTYLIDARAEIDELNEDLGLNIPTGAYETVGGAIIGSLGRIPQAGEQISLNGLRITILEATANRVKKVRIVAPRGEGWQKSS